MRFWKPHVKRLVRLKVGGTSSVWMQFRNDGMELPHVFWQMFNYLRHVLLRDFRFQGWYRFTAITIIRDIVINVSTNKCSMIYCNMPYVDTYVALRRSSTLHIIVTATSNSTFVLYLVLYILKKILRQTVKSPKHTFWQKLSRNSQKKSF